MNAIPNGENCDTERASVKGLSAIQISAGRNQAYALKADGTLVGWGENDYGQIDTPQLLVWRGNGVRSSTAPDTTSIGADDRPHMDEANQRSVEGNRSMVDQEAVRWTQVASGDNHTCAVTTEGEVHCWGSNSHGQSEIPMRLLVHDNDPQIPNPRFTKIVAGGNYTCLLEAETTVTVTALRSGGATEMPAGSLVCWGTRVPYAQTGNLGDSPPSARPIPSTGRHCRRTTLRDRAVSRRIRSTAISATPMRTKPPTGTSMSAPATTIPARFAPAVSSIAGAATSTARAIRRDS